MNPLVFKLIKILFFACSSYLSGRVIISRMNRGRAENKYSLSDPEIIAVSVFVGAAMTSVIFSLIPRLLK